MDAVSWGPGGLYALVSPNSDEDLGWHIPGAHETSHPFINLDLRMYFLFLSTYPDTLRLTRKLSRSQCRVQLQMLLDRCLSDPTLWVSYPIKNWPSDQHEGACLVFLSWCFLSMMGHFSSSLSSNEFYHLTHQGHSTPFLISLLETSSSLVFQDTNALAYLTNHSYAHPCSPSWSLNVSVSQRLILGPFLISTFMA